MHIPRKWKHEWEKTNPILRNGEPGLEIDSNRMKVGDGRLRWVDLPFISPPLGVTGGGGGTIPDNGVIDGGEP